MLTGRGTLIFAQRDDDGLIEVIDRDGVRTLYFGTGAAQSSMYRYEPTRLALEYTRCMLAALIFHPQPRRVLLIGLGGGSLARFMLEHLPGARTECVEKRSGVVELARRYFDLPDERSLAIHIGDGAEFLRDSPAGCFDLILVDAFDGAGIHRSVCPASFFANCRRTLTDDGVLSINLWATPGAPLNTILDGMQDGFGGQILRLPVERRANLIALGLTTPRSRSDLKLLREPARELAARLGVDFPKHLRRLEQHNGSAVRRFLRLGIR